MSDRRLNRRVLEQAVGLLVDLLPRILEIMIAAGQEWIAVKVCFPPVEA